MKQAYQLTMNMEELITLAAALCVSELQLQSLGLTPNANLIQLIERVTLLINSTKPLS